MTNLANISIRDRVRAHLGEVRLVALGLFQMGCHCLGFGKLYRSFLIQLTKRTGLFDRAFYIEVNGDVVGEGIPPLRHYVEYGDREGRSPMALFDPAYYRSHARGKTTRLNALLHYAYVGRYRRISPSPWFDVGYYLAHNKDVARAGFDPLLHFVKWGGNEGRSPTPDFDSDFYLRTNPEVVNARLNPLLHYLRYGRLEGRKPLPDQTTSEPKGSGFSKIDTALPNDEWWASLRSRAARRDAQLDVIVPVFKGKLETLRCLYSVLCANTEIDFELVVIDDKSPESDLVDELHKLANCGLFTLLSNAENRGFVYTVNRGIALHGTRDVVLLNSDTEVYDGWLERLCRAANRHERNATVTPLSNNATICSYPRFLHDNPFPLELAYADLDALTAQVNAERDVIAPTGVGFCMYIKRACLEEIGVFDENAFGKGYGEENDFCQRAISYGWRNVIAADTFVHHWGATSFRGERAQRVQAALKVVHKRYPKYQQDVSEFIARDPLADARGLLDFGRLQRMCRDENVLIVSHNRGGGTERHIQEDIERIERQGHGVFRVVPIVGEPSLITISHPSIKATPNLRPLELADTAAVIALLRSLRITQIHSHGLVDFLPTAPEHLAAIARALGIHWEINLHDYKVICPRINLADENGVYCGEPQERECNRCLKERGSDFQVLDISTWRAMHRAVLRGAARVLVPSHDVAARLTRYFPEIAYEVSPHDDIDASAQINLPRLDAKQRLRIVVVGAIGKLKGFDVLLACAKHARQNNLPLQFTLMGFSMNDRLLRDAGVKITGKYSDRDATSILRGLYPHVVWLPSLWPETYSYTLSIALSVGTPVVAFDIGAIADRLRAIGYGEFLVPLSWARDAKRVNSVFLQKFVKGQMDDPAAA